MKTNEVVRKLTLAGWMVACSLWPALGMAGDTTTERSASDPLAQSGSGRLPVAPANTTHSCQECLIVRGGFNLSSASIGPEVDQKPRPGFNAALLADVSLGVPMFSLIIGSGFETRGVAGDDEGAFRLNYITFPVMFSFHQPLASGGPVLFINLGTESAFLISSDSSDSQINDVAFDADNFETYDLGLRTEVGVELPLIPNGPSAHVGAGYSYSVTDANEDEDDTWYNHALHLFLGLEFGI